MERLPNGDVWSSDSAVPPDPDPHPESPHEVRRPSTQPPVRPPSPQAADLPPPPPRVPRPREFDSRMGSGSTERGRTTDTGANRFGVLPPSTSRMPGDTDPARSEPLHPRSSTSAAPSRDTCSAAHDANPGTLPTPFASTPATDSSPDCTGGQAYESEASTSRARPGHTAGKTTTFAGPSLYPQGTSKPASGPGARAPPMKPVWELCDDSSPEEAPQAESTTQGPPEPVSTDAGPSDTGGWEAALEQSFSDQLRSVHRPASESRWKGKEKLQDTSSSLSESPDVYYQELDLGKVGNQRTQGRLLRMPQQERGNSSRIPPRENRDEITLHQTVQMQGPSVQAQQGGPRRPNIPPRSALDPRLVVQQAVLGVDHLESHEDIRCQPNSDKTKPVIRPGDEVICVEDTTLTEPEPSNSTSFSMRKGDVYIVIRIYSDLWASCVKLSMTDPIQPAFPQDGILRRNDRRMAWVSSLDKVGFLPLCCVTLAANFGEYTQRNYHLTGQPLVAPHLGQPVLAPKRDSSRTDEDAVEQGGWVRLPRELFDMTTRYSANARESSKHGKAFAARGIGHGSESKPDTYVTTSATEWPSRRTWLWGFALHTIKKSLMLNKFGRKRSDAA